MSRAVPEWIGKTDDAKVPPRVRLRIFEREGGICHLSGRKIMPGELWELDHKIALINGGEHRESNLFPALKDKHKEKTREDVAEKSRIADKRGRHIGSLRPAGNIKSPGFKPAPPQRRASKPVEKLSTLPRNQFYTDAQ